MKHHLDFMGFHVKDKVTGFSGVVTCVAFDLYGCVQGAVTPRATAATTEKSGKLEDSHWFDLSRLMRTDTEETPVMPVPSFAQVAAATPGGHAKPPFRS